MFQRTRPVRAHGGPARCAMTSEDIDFLADGLSAVNQPFYGLPDEPETPVPTSWVWSGPLDCPRHDCSLIHRFPEGNRLAVAHRSHQMGSPVSPRITPPHRGGIHPEKPASRTSGLGYQPDFPHKTSRHPCEFLLSWRPKESWHDSCSVKTAERMPYFARGFASSVKGTGR